MPTRPLAALAVALSLSALAGCEEKASPSGGATLPPAKKVPVVFPELGPGRVLEPGVRVHEVSIDRGGVPMKVWFYLPDKPADKLALVLVPPAGSTLIAGMALGEGDRAGQTPYVKAGFAVASFEIDGAVANKRQASDAALMKAARAFRDARAGLDNAETALDFVLAKVPAIDPERVYVAGHSSAATLALLVAEYDPRIKGCVAFAPCTDVELRVAVVIETLESSLPGYAEFLKFSSPQTHAELLTCPLFLFHAQDDDNVPFAESARFHNLVKKTNPQATFVKAVKGGHHAPMVREGMPKAIAWLKQLPKA